MGLFVTPDAKKDYKTNVKAAIKNLELFLRSQEDGQYPQMSYLLTFGKCCIEMAQEQIKESSEDENE